MLRGVSPFKVGKRQHLFEFVSQRPCGTAPVSAPLLLSHIVKVVKDSHIQNNSEGKPKPLLIGEIFVVLSILILNEFQ